MQTEARKEKDHPVGSQVLNKEGTAEVDLSMGFHLCTPPPSAALCCSARLSSPFCNAEQGSLLQCIIALVSELCRYLEAR